MNCIICRHAYFPNCYVIGGQTCFDSANSIQQNGDDQLGRRNGRLGIVPRLNFSCNSRITVINARVRRDNNMDRNGYLSFNIWRPSSTNSMVYNNIGEVQLQQSQVFPCNSDRYCNVSIDLTDNDRIEFQSGDVVGYYHPSDALYQVRTIQTTGYILYRIDGSPAPTSVDLSTVNDNRIDDRRQPLIQFVIGTDRNVCMHTSLMVVICIVKTAIRAVKKGCGQVWQPYTRWPG